MNQRATYIPPGYTSVGTDVRKLVSCVISEKAMVSRAIVLVCHSHKKLHSPLSCCFSAQNITKHFIFVTSTHALQHHEYTAPSCGDNRLLVVCLLCSAANFIPQMNQKWKKEKKTLIEIAVTLKILKYTKYILFSLFTEVTYLIT